MKKPVPINRWLKALGACSLLVGATGCLGPNPLFFVGSTATGTTITRLVNILLDNLLAGG